jgi:hypothetical protein
VRESPKIVLQVPFCFAFTLLKQPTFAFQSHTPEKKARRARSE